MDFIEYSFPNDVDQPVSKNILKTRREQLGLSQQQVAQATNMQLRQYQRLESGERNIETATMRTAMAVCAVLKLDPFTFFPECHGMNMYADRLNQVAEPLMKEEAIPLLLEKACQLFNDQFDTNYSLNNIKVAYCTLDNIQEVYSAFTKKYGFISEQRTAEQFADELAEAFVGQTDCDDYCHVDGILIRTDPPAVLDNPENYMKTIVHELAHIFSTTHETPEATKAARRFYNVYCDVETSDHFETISNGQISAGYAIWQEFIADIIQDIISPDPSSHLKDILPELKILVSNIRVGKLAAKLSLSEYLARIMNTWEGSEAKSWEELHSKLQEMHLPFVRIIHHVFDMLHNDIFYTITADNIQDLGAMFLADMIQNTPQEDLLRFAAVRGLRF